MKDIIFRSDKFQPYLPDGCQVNPNVFGFELAHWLSAELMKVGLVTSYPNHEDWGWFIEHSIDDREYMICCSGFKDSDELFEWRVYVERPSRLFSRPKTNNADVSALITMIAKCLANSGINHNIDE